MVSATIISIIARRHLFPSAQSRDDFGDQVGNRKGKAMAGTLTARKVTTAKPGI
jgi:hypothetical protein